MDNPHKSHAQRAWNEGRAEAFEEITEITGDEE